MDGSVRAVGNAGVRIVNSNQYARIFSRSVVPQELGNQDSTRLNSPPKSSAAPHVSITDARTRTATQMSRAVCALALASTLLGCEADSWMDPSRTGYFETTPTTMPVITRLDVIERQGLDGVTYAKPTAEDLVPGELKYRLAPGDVVRVEVFELITPGQPEVEERTIDQTGNVRLKEIGDVVAAGLTIEEFQAEIVQKVGRILEEPVVSVSLERGQSFQYSISGSVQSNGVFSLTRPDFRLSEAIALAGGTLPTTQRVTVIRAAPIDDTLNPIYPEREVGPDGPTRSPIGNKPTTTEKPAVNIDDLINELEGGKKPEAAPTTPFAPTAEPAPTSEPAPTPPASGIAPGMVSDVPSMNAQDSAPPVDVDDLASPPTIEAQPTPATAAQSGFTFDTTTGRWVRGSSATRATTARAGGEEPTAAQSMYATRVIEVDYQQLIKGDPNLDIVIRPSDRIYVEPPETGFLYIDGEINRIGVYNLENTNGRLTLSRFVSASGGLAPTAIPNRVDLVRVVGRDREATIRVDLAAIRNRSEPDIYMQKDDHVIIGTNFFAVPLAVIRNGFRMTYGFGFLLDRNFGNDVFGPPPENFTVN
ncbi:MAG: hypothetical protein DWH97_02525 [Planctomycetota bacterium]|nr:MAG: hypothetical protein DWH97_02525 [Planctomycetota bacterium]RLS93307.1 MAG: hypothetical protein DWI12_09405 [Planctomycetota bacterium]